jgi:hypothetical protein
MESELRYELSSTHRVVIDKILATVKSNEEKQRILDEFENILCLEQSINDRDHLIVPEHLKNLVFTV